MRYRHTPPRGGSIAALPVLPGPPQKHRGGTLYLVAVGQVRVYGTGTCVANQDTCWPLLSCAASGCPGCRAYLTLQLHSHCSPCYCCRKATRITEPRVTSRPPPLGLLLAVTAWCKQRSPPATATVVVRPGDVKDPVAAPQPDAGMPPSHS